MPLKANTILDVLSQCDLPIADASVNSVTGFQQVEMR